MSRRPRSEWLYQRQDGKCCLRVTPQCNEVDGRLAPSPYAGGKGDPRGWTYDHIIPKSRSRKLTNHNRLTLLACSACNTAKGSRRPSAELLALALEIGCDYYTKTNEPHAVVQLKKLVAAYSERIAARSAQSDNTSVVDVSAIEAALGRTVPRSYANSPAWRAATAAALGVTEPRFLPGAKRSR